MDNKDQLNQIPVDANDSQDEKTTKIENQDVEAGKSKDSGEVKKAEQPESEKQPQAEPVKASEVEDQEKEKEAEKPVAETEPEAEKKADQPEAKTEEEEQKPAEAEPVAEVSGEKEAEKPVAETEPEAEKKSDQPETKKEAQEQKPAEAEPVAEVSEEKEKEAEKPVAETEPEAEKKSDQPETKTEAQEQKPAEAEPVAEVVAEVVAAKENEAEKPVSETEPEAEKKSDQAEEKTVEEEQKPAEAEPVAAKEKEAEKPEAETKPEIEKKSDQPEAKTEEQEQKPAEAEPTAEVSGEKQKSETEPKAEEKVTDDHDLSDEDHDDDEEEEHEPEEDVDYNSLSREELVTNLEEIVAAEDINSIKSKVSQIKVAYLKKTKAEKEAQIDQSLSDDDADDKEETAPVEDVLEVKFNKLFDIYKQKRAIFLENLEKEKIENLGKKKQILEDLKNLIGSEETLKKTYDDFKELQDRWKEIGMVPKSEVNNLWQNYHFLVEKFFDKVKINKELKDLDLKKNMEQKIELCEQAEELLLENSIIKSFKELQRLHEQWKEIGPVPADKNEDLWERFKSTTDKINQRRREHYKQLQEQHEKNYEAKVGLCEKAEELLPTEVKTIRDWQNKTKHFNEMFRVWKTIGPASKKQNDEIWERFKAALDSFFKDKKEYFAKLKEQQINNYNLKLDLCVRAEGIKDSTDWKQTTRDLINLQKEWKEIGPVPRKHSDKIWKRFRAACDEFFNRKSDHFSHIRDEEKANLDKKEALIKQVEDTEFGADRNENLNKLKGFQRQWTEIGFVPFKEKDRLQNAFRSAVDKQLDKLNISSTEISMENYKSKMEVLKGSPDGNKSLGRERNFIQGKINQLRDDIHVWENNIGFLADSKKASLFKDEFEKKIEKARKELEVLEAKLKFLSR